MYFNCFNALLFVYSFTSIFILFLLNILSTKLAIIGNIKMVYKDRCLVEVKAIILNPSTKNN